MHLGKAEEILGKFRKILFDTAQCKPTTIIEEDTYYIQFWI